MIGGEVILLQRWSLATSRVGAHSRSKRKSSAETCIKISVTESFDQRCEHWLARAVARRNAFDLERIFQSRHRLCDNIIRRDDKVEAAGDQMNFGIDSRRGLDNSFNPWMSAADHQHHTLRGVDSKR
jgi:hypothetical protein